MTKQNRPLSANCKNYIRLGYWLKFTGIVLLAFFQSKICAQISNLDNWTVNATISYRYLIKTIIQADGQFVAVDENFGVVLTSLNGTSWAVHETNASILNDIVWSGSQFIAVGEKVQYIGAIPVFSSGVIVTSSDGVTWAEAFDDISGGQDYVSVSSLAGVASGSGKIVVVGGNTNNGTHGTIIASSDGTTWVSNNPGTSKLNSIAWGCRG